VSAPDNPINNPLTDHPGPALDTRFFGHPRGLSTLFFTEMWERFSYYGMRAILILYMTAPLVAGGMGLETSIAGPIYGLYTASVYLVALPGGWFADRILGQQRAVLWGGIIIMLGHISLAMSGLQYFLTGLFLVVVGTGLLKPNISTLVGQLYTPEDQRRDSGFSIYYMGINLGAFIAPLVCGWLAQSESFRGMLAGWGLTPESSWHWGFGAAAVGMFFGIVQYSFGRKNLRGAGQAPGDPFADATRRTASIGLIIGVVLIAALILVAARQIFTALPGMNRIFGILLTITPLAFFAWLLTMGSRTREERKRHIVILVLFLGATVFWSAFEQAGSTLNLFAERSTRTEVFGKSFPASWFQSANSFWILALAPVFAWLWIRLGKREPTSPAKFALGLFFVAAGFGILIIAAQLSDQGQQVSPMWLVATYFLHTVGELCLSPVGLSAMTRLAPVRYAGLILGVWFLATSLGNFVGGQVAGVYEDFSTAQIFAGVTIFVAIAAVLLAITIKPIKKMMSGS
jgi:POT family proton-dependent oligopeptide transporter